MKLIIAVLLLAIGAFAQNTKYMDGTDCECDSIVTIPTNEMILQSALHNGKSIEEKLFTWYKNKYILIRLSINSNGKCSSLELYDLYGNVKGEVYYGDEGSLEIVHTTKGHSIFINRDNNGLRNGITTWVKTGGIDAGRAEYKNGRLIGYKHCSDGRFGNESLDCLN